MMLERREEFGTVSYRLLHGEKIDPKLIAAVRVEGVWYTTDTHTDTVKYHEHGQAVQHVPNTVLRMCVQHGDRKFCTEMGEADCEAVEMVTLYARAPFFPSDLKEHL